MSYQPVQADLMQFWEIRVAPKNDAWKRDALSMTDKKSYLVYVLSFKYF